MAADTPPSPQAMEIRALTAVRGIAALYVVAYHASDAAGINLAPRGYLAVDLFFVLSGFVLTLSSADAFSAHGWRAFGAFLGRRVARIMPLNLAVVALVTAANLASHGGAGVPAGRVACNALALQGFGWCVTLNAPAWTLAFEWLAYALFPAAVALVLFAGRAACGAAVAAAVAALIAFAAASGRGTLDSSQFGAGWSVVRCLSEMVLGIAAYRAFSSPRLRAAASSDASLAAVLLLGAAGCTFGERSAWWIGGDVWVVAAFPALILCLAANEGRAGRWLGWAPLHGLGVVSFSIYLLHDAILQREWRWSGVGPVWFVMLATISVVPVAVVSYTAVERPCRRALRRIIQ